MPKLKMIDFWTFKPKEIMDNKKHLFECKDATSPTGSSLLVKVAATHSGVVNQNHRFYRPDRMQDAAHQWVPEAGKGYPKPVLFEHDQKSDVLGRVRTARYIDESYKWAGSFPTVKDSIFYNVGDKKVDLFKSVDWIVDNLMGISDYSGLGYIELGLNVTNPDAINKVLRDEYLTVSVGFKTGSAICSICHTDWAVDDKCDHSIGEKDKESGRPAFLICGDFIYEELSFVNFPADPFAGKISKDTLKDTLNRKFFMGLSHDKQQAFVAAAGMSMSDAVMDYDIQLVEDKVATEEELEIQAAITADKQTCGCKTGEACACDTDWSREALTDEEQTYFADEEGLYAEMCIEIDAALAAKELTDAQVKDAKLSTAARGKLGSSTFCGPGRSFPVPDCAHVTAARRLIGRAKVGDGVKSKILACVSRKASSLGCGGKKDGVPQVPENTDTIKNSDEFTTYAKTLNLNLADGHGVEALGLYTSIDKCYNAACDETKGNIRMLHYDLGSKWNADSSLAYAKKYIKEKDKDSILITAKELADKDQAVTTLTEEVAAKAVVIDTAKATATEMLKGIKKALATQIVMYKSLTGNTDYKGLDQTAISAKVDELSKRHVTSLKDAVADIMSELKWVESPPANPTDKVNEPGKSVADNAQVSPAVVAATDSVVETPAEKLKKLQAEDLALRQTLAPMNKRERDIYLSDLAYNTAKTASSKSN